MKSLDFFLILLAPFVPRWAFNRLKNSDTKKLNILSALIIVIAGTCLSKQPTLSIGLFFSLGYIFNIIITGIVIATLSSKLLPVKLDLQGGVSIAAASAFPFMAFPVLQLMFNISPFTLVIQNCLYCLLISIGLSTFHVLPFRRTVSIGILVLIFKGLVALSFSGIEL